MFNIQISALVHTIHTAVVICRLFTFS